MRPPRPVFVTSFFTIYPATKQQVRPLEWRLQKFRQLLETGILIVLFTDDIAPFAGMMREFRDTFRIGKVLTIQDTDLYKNFSGQIRQLPCSANPEKDTEEFFWVMMLKTEFLEKAIHMDVFGTGSTVYCWIDFSIAYIFKSPETTLAFIRTIGNSTMDLNTVYIPGCWGEKQTRHFEERILWRFCGGIVIGNTQHLLNMNQIVNAHFAEYLKQYNGTLTWEVNYWAWLEYHNYFHPTWYYANHDDWMILGIPSRACFSRFDPLYRKPLLFPQLFLDSKWTPSSASFLRHSKIQGEGYLVVRYVNYRLNDAGAYWFPDDADRGIIKNENVLFRVKRDNDGYYQLVPNSGCVCSRIVLEMTPERPLSFGLEDVRLWTNSQGETRWIATNVDLTENGLPQIITGGFCLNTAHITDWTLHQTDQMQKNWIYWNEDEVVYQWKMDGVYFRHLRTGEIRHVPYRVSNSILSCVRGSSIFLPGWNVGERIAVVHYSEEGSPRKYYHVLVVLREDTGELLRHSLPFYLGRNGPDGNHCINFCIGFDWTADPTHPYEHLFHFWFSVMDREPEYWVVREREQIRWCSYENATTQYTLVKNWVE